MRAPYLFGRHLDALGGKMVEGHVRAVLREQNFLVGKVETPPNRVFFQTFQKLQIVGDQIALMRF